MSKKVEAPKVAKKVNRNSIADHLAAWAAAATIMLFAMREMLRHIKAVYPMNIALAAVFIVFLGLVVLAPAMRNHKG